MIIILLVIEPGQEWEEVHRETNRPYLLTNIYINYYFRRITDNLMLVCISKYS